MRRTVILNLRKLSVFVALLCSVAVQPLHAGTANAAMQAFANNCFSPYMTADKAAKLLAMPGTRVDFYDLDPFSNVAPSPVLGRSATSGTDRRCEIAFDGDHRMTAATAAVDGLLAEGITTDAPLPDTYTKTDGTELLAARQLNPKRIAVVHVGTRPGPNGAETFMMVERLTPSIPSN